MHPNFRVNCTSSGNVRSGVWPPRLLVGQVAMPEVARDMTVISFSGRWNEDTWFNLRARGNHFRSCKVQVTKHDRHFRSHAASSYRSCRPSTSWQAGYNWFVPYHGHHSPKKFKWNEFLILMMTIYVTTDSTVETTERYQDNWALSALLRQQRAMWQVTTALLRQQRVVKLKECFNYQDNKRQSASRHQSRQNADPDEEQALSSTMLYEVRESIFICLSLGTSSIVINNVVRGKRVNIHMFVTRNQ